MIRSQLLLFSVAVVAYSASLAIRVERVDPQQNVRRELKLDQSLLVSPGPSALQAASMGHALAVSDLLWLGLVQEVGKVPPPESPAWDRIEHLAHITTDLDPSYFNPYHATAILLALHGGRVEASDRLLLKGWKALPREWQLPFMLGYNAYFIHGHPGLAADYMLAASQLEGSPSYLPALAGRMRYHSGDVGGAMALLEMLIPTLEGAARRDAEERLAMLRSEEILAKYDEACRRYRDEHGIDPPDPEQLRQWARILEPPYDELGNPIELNDCVARTTIIKVRESEAQGRIRSEAEGRGLNLEASDPSATPP
ncbi:MAG: hypothetical protein IT384_00405 [Deltaproteobacteria bacterium]|nr:hypothetical protein [Deltaproteobacteria bacterium]